MRELDRLKCIQGLIDKQLKQKAVSERLGLTVRQVRRLVERYELEGPRGLIFKLRDREAVALNKLSRIAIQINPSSYDEAQAVSIADLSDSIGSQTRH